MLNGFHSALLIVRDFERGVEDYARLLGRSPAWRGVYEATGVPAALFPLANTTLELRGGSSAGRVAEEGLEAENAGLLDEALEAARAGLLDEALEAARAGLLDEAGEGLCGIRLAVDDLAGIESALVSRGLARGTLRTERAAGVDGALDRLWRVLPLDLAASRTIPVELVSDPAKGGSSLEADRVEPARREGIVESLDHVVVFSADLEASRAFYGAALGIRLALDRSFEARGVRLLFFRLGGVTIEIAGRLGAEPQREARDRFGGLAWRVADVEATRSRLADDGFDVSEVRAGHKPGTRVCTVRAPVHGVPTLLIEPPR